MRRFFLILMASAVIFTGCTVHLTPEEREAKGRLAANLRTNIAQSALKVSGNKFDAYDKVGLYMKQAGQPLTSAGAVYSNAANVEMSLSEQTLISDPPVNYPESGNVDFIAYYPYTTVVGSDYSVDINVAGQESGLPLEVLYSNNVTWQAPTTLPVTLNFLYSLAKLEVTVRGGQNSTLAEADFYDMTASIDGMFTQAKLQLAGGAFANRQEQQLITLYKTGNTATSATFEALILPTAEADGEMTFAFQMNGVTYRHRQTTNYETNSLYKLNFELNFTAGTTPTATLLNTYISPRNEYTQTIPVDATPDDKLFFVDISEETYWDLLIATSDGSGIFLNLNENADMPTQLFFKPDANSDEGFSIFFHEDGLPEAAVFGDYIIYFSNFRGNLFDFALIYPDKFVEYFYNIDADVDWDSFLAPSIRPLLFGINLNKIGNFITNTVSTVTNAVTSVAPAVVSAINVGFSLATDGILGAAATVVNIVNDYTSIDVPSELVNIADFIGTIGTGLACATALTNPISALGCITGVADMILNPKDNPIEDFFKENIKNGDLYNPIIVQAKAVLDKIAENVPDDFMEMVFVQGGTFMMGQEGVATPVHKVSLGNFNIGKYPVTQGQWKAVMGSNPSYFPQGDNYPVNMVSWDDVQVFITLLNTATGKNYRLPTEAEWEYAARGGNQSQGYEYSGSNNIDDVAWYSDNSGISTHPVGTKAPNELGIYDMSGNVWEWCSDWYVNYSSEAQTNPTGPATGSARVLRGGSWFNNASYCRVAYRFGSSPGDRDSSIGFRVVLP